MITGTALYEFAKEWQTLIAALLAFSGAWATLAGVRRQVEFAERAEQKRRADEGFAARAVIPAALSEISGYADECIAQLMRSLRRPTAANPYTGLEDLPLPPHNVSTIVKDAIRFTGEPERALLIQLLSVLQVHSSRLRDARSKATRVEVTAFTKEQLIVDSAVLKAKASALYHWARVYEKSEIMYAPAPEVWKELITVEVYPEEFPQIRAMVDMMPGGRSHP